MESHDKTADAIAGNGSHVAARMSAADRASLSALAANDYAAGRARIAAAMIVDPLNPVHRVRGVLLEMRFGRYEEASRLSDALAVAMPSHPLPAYLRGLASLRMGEAARARNVAAALVTSHADFAPARFLRAEAQSHVNTRGLAKLLGELPQQPQFAAAWADLLAKLVIAHPKEGEKLARQHLKNRKVFPDDSPEAACVENVLRLAAADADELEEIVASQRPDSRSEEITLLFYHDRLSEEEDPRAALARVRRLHDRLPQRRAIRRLYTAQLARQAVAEAGREDYAASLRLTERCQTLQPHEATYYQNRAALFTLLKESEPYHDAWFELNRHHYRLALLGRFSSADALRIAKLHRLFAQQARLTRGQAARGQTSDGIFREERQGGETAERTVLLVHQERIAHEPDLLRQWLVHTQAELVFRHGALGGDAFRFLLHPTDSHAARQRLDSLAALAQSLEVLVPEEGQMLAQEIVACWNEAGRGVQSQYAAIEDDADIASVQQQVLETIADLTVLLLGWQPDGRRPDLVEDLLRLLQALLAFFDEQVLYATVKRTDPEPKYSVKLLASFVDDTLDLPGDEPRLDESQRRQVAQALQAELLVRMSLAVYDAYREMKGAADRALVFVDRVRDLDMEEPRYELIAARFLALGEYFTEARQAVSRFYRFDGARNRELLTEIEEIQKYLEENKKSEGKRRENFQPDEPLGEFAGAEVDQLLAELQTHPNSIRVYEDLAHAYASQGRYEDAASWSERAVAKCLGRQGQVRARNLSLEILGLAELGRLDQQVVSLYLRGAHRPALELVESQPPSKERGYGLWYVFGRCQLAVNRPEDARQSFGQALAGCQRRIHRAVLKRLMSNIDEAYLQFARQTIGDEVSAGRYGDALREAATAMRQLQQPELCLLDVAQIFLAHAAEQLGGERDVMPLPAPPFQVSAGWQDRLSDALAGSDDFERCARLVELCVQLFEPSRKEAEALL